MIELRSITAQNFYEILALKVAENQKAYVSTVAESLAQAWLYHDTAYPFAIYADHIPVGFVMLGYYESRKQYTLWKFLIDEEYQNRGYGRQALRQALCYLTERFDVQEIYTGVLIGNEKARRLYSAVGFAETGKTEENMMEMKYTCEK